MKLGTKHIFNIQNVETQFSGVFATPLSITFELLPRMQPCAEDMTRGVFSELQ